MCRSSAGPDELVPEDATAAKAPPLADSFAPAADGGRCLDCPKHDHLLEVCPLQGRHRSGRSPMCRYGHYLTSLEKR